MTYRPIDSEAEVQLADEHAAQNGPVAFLVACTSPQGSASYSTDRATESRQRRRKHIYHPSLPCPKGSTLEILGEGCEMDSGGGVEKE